MGLERRRRQHRGTVSGIAGLLRLVVADGGGSVIVPTWIIPSMIRADEYRDVPGVDRPDPQAAELAELQRAKRARAGLFVPLTQEEAEFAEAAQAYLTTRRNSPRG